MKTKLKLFAANCSASVNIEYGLLALLIGVTLIGALSQISENTGARYNAIANAFTSSETTGSIP